VFFLISVLTEHTEAVLRYVEHLCMRANIASSQKIITVLLSYAVV